MILHLQNTPNDLQLLSDAPAHHIFVLLGPVDPNQSALPEVLCVLQVRLGPDLRESLLISVFFLFLFFCKQGFPSGLLNKGPRDSLCGVKGSLIIIQGFVVSKGLKLLPKY